MTFWEVLGLLGILLLWGVLGLVPAFATVVVRRGRASLAMLLPLAFAAGIAGAVLVPALGAKGGLGFALSLLAALVAGAVASFFFPRLARIRSPEAAL